MKIGLLVVLVFFSMMLMVFPMGNVTAITGNYQPDGNAHPYVGFVGLYVYDEGGDLVPAWCCTGILISPGVVLTAGHCTEGADIARVWFDEGPIDWPDGAGATYYEGKPHAYPGFSVPLRGNAHNGPFYVTGDVGVVVLDKDVPTSVVSSYGQLPSEGMVDDLPVGTGVDLVGYGVQEQARPKNTGPYNAWYGPIQRFHALANLMPGQFSWSDEFLRVSANAAQGKGGIAFGDSGGPVLLKGTDTVLAVNSYVTSINCAGVTYHSRIDNPVVLEWINDFLEEP